MKMNAKKTKTMVITRSSPTPKLKITIDGEEVKQVESFTYLGQLITEDGKNDNEIMHRISIARSVFNKMRTTLTSRRLSINIRKRILKCYVWSTLLYGCETWTLSDNIIKRLNAFEMWTYRRMLRISWTDKITNESVLQTINNPLQITNIIKKKKLQYFGHLMRHNNISRTLLDGHINGKRSRGRPRAMWSHNIIEWTGKNYENAVRTAKDRKKWKSIISSNPVQQDGT